MRGIYLTSVEHTGINFPDMYIHVSDGLIIFHSTVNTFLTAHIGCFVHPVNYTML